MAIKSNLGEINQLQQKVQKKDNIQQFVSETLLGLSQNLDNKLVVDPIMSSQITNIALGLDVTQQITDLNTQLTGQRQKLRSSNNVNVVNLTYTTNTLNSTVATIRNIQNERSTQQRILTQEEGIRSNLKAPQGGGNNNNNNNNNNWQNYQTQLNQINDRISNCNDYILECDRALAILEQIQSLQELTTYYGTIIQNRQGELNIIKAIIDSFNQGAILTPIVSQIGQNVNIQTPLNPLFLNNNQNISYSICNNENGDVIPLDSGNLQVVQNGKTISLEGIAINNGQLEIGTIKVKPIEDVTFPIKLNLSVRGRITDQITGLSLDHHKPIDITINAPQLDQAARQVAYDHLNATSSINQKIDSLYAASNNAREDDVIWEMLAAGGNKDEVEAARKNPVKSKEFIRRARASGIVIPVINLPNTYPNFRDYITDEKRKVPVEHLVDGENFKNYLRNNLDKSIEEYLKKDIRKQIDIPNNRVKLLDAFIETNTVLTQAERGHAYDDLNTGNTINDRINVEHTNNNTAREEDVIREILGESGSKEEMEAIRKNDAQAKELIKKMRSLVTIPVVPIGTLQAGFKTAMIDPTRAIPEEYLINEETFKNYLGKDLDKNIVDHLRKTIKKNLDTPTNRGILMRELLNFQTELKNNKIDSTVDQDALGDLAGVEMDSKRWLPLFGRKDVNYMRFFSGASVDMGSQTVNLNKEVKYSMNLKVSGKNEIMATVKIGDKKEKTYKAGNPMAMIEKILKEKEIPEGKTRLHVAYNIIAGMIQIAKNEDISLSYRDAAGHNQVIKLDGKNIVLEDQDDLTNHATGRRNTRTLFDYSLFESTNSFEDPNRSGRHVLTPDNRTLRVGLERLTKHFNVAMNQVNANYDCATERKGGILRSNTSSDFPTSAWTSPIKKLLNCKTTTNFDFATSVNHNGKSVQIERKGNIFFLTIDGVELKGKDLGKLLKKRKGGIRLFDGVERAICGEIYKNMVEKLRTNTKIARSSFGVMDPKTGRMYIIDEDGQLGYLRAEEAGVEEDNLHRRPGVNTVVNGAVAGGLAATGLATGWVPFLGAAATIGGTHIGASVSLPFVGATAASIPLFKDIRRIAGRGYGTLDHAPAARTICDEAETREVYKDPFLMGKLMKVMNLRLGQL